MVDSFHIPVSSLWRYTADPNALDGHQVDHLKHCERCIRTLQLCCLGNSIAHVERLLDECGAEKLLDD